MTTFAHKFGNLALRAANFLGYSPDVYSAIGGGFRTGHATSGKTVSTETALKVVAWKRGIQIVSDYVGKTPFHVTCGHEKDKQHNAWPLVRKWAIRDVVSAREFRRSMTAKAMATGNSVAYIQRIPGTMQPVSLQMMPTGSCRPVKLPGGIVRYKVEGQHRTLPAHDVIHIKGFSLDELWGDDPLTGYARDVLGLAIAEQDYAAGYFEKGGAPTTWAHAEHHLKEDEYNEINARLNQNGGLQQQLNSEFDIPICEGFELKNLTPTAEQAQLLESREFSLTDVANAIGISVHKLQGKRNAAYKSLTEENEAFGDDTLDPFFCQFEEQYEKLCTEAERDTGTHEVAAVRESLKRTNAKDKSEVVKTSVGGPWMTINEGRAIDSLPPVEGGDVLIPMAATPSEPPATDDEDNDNDNDNDEDTDADTERRSAALAEVFQRINRRMSKQVQKAAKGKPDALATFLASLEERNAGTLTEALGPLAALIAGEDIDAEPLALRHIDDFRSHVTRATIDTDNACDSFEAMADGHAAQLLQELTS